METNIIEKIYVQERNIVLDEVITGSAAVKKYIAGIPCSIVDKKEEILAKFQQEDNKRLAILNKLNNSNLDRLGVLPTSIFKKLVNNNKLYTFKNISDDGYVQGDVKNLVDSATADGSSFALFLLTSVALAVYFFFLQGWTLAIAGGVVAFVVRVALGASASGESKFVSWLILPEVSMLEFFTKKYVCSRPEKYLFPDRTDCNLQKQSYSQEGEDAKKLNKIIKEMKASIELYPAPQSTEERLIAWTKAGYKPYLVVDEKSFSVKISGEYKNSLNKALALRDPMVCVDIDDYTVIVDQYGPFFKEKEIVQHVKEHFSMVKAKMNLN